jgi:RND family efflux transporter MFP subunit
VDKRALLDELKIDRGVAVDEQPRRPIRWFALIAAVAGIAFMAWYVVFPKADPAAVAAPVVATPVMTAPKPAAIEGSVLDATGYVVPRRQATVSAKTTGKVVEVFIEEGMRVQEGQVLARLDASTQRAELALSESQLASARSGLEEMKVQIRQAELDLQRTQGLAARKLASAADLDRVQLTLEGLQARLERQEREVVVADRAASVHRQLVDDMEIRAPFAGVVTAKAAQPGEMISPVSAGGGFTRTGICTIVDMESLEVEVDVNEAYINRVQPKQPVSVALNAYPDEHIPAEVIAIIPTADRNKATVRVRIALLEKNPRVLPEMGVKVAFLEDHAAAS